MKKLTLAAIALGLFGMKPAIANDTQLWSALAVNGPVKEDSRLLVWFDGHARFGDDVSALRTSIIRPAVGWRASENLDLWVGYARVTAHRDGPDVGEDRIWQQATYPVADVFGGALSGRTRIEQRFRAASSDVGLRFRQFWRWSRPIDGSQFSWVVANETFVAVNDAGWGQFSGYDQNRAFFGLGWKVAPKIRIEGGYLNNHLNNGPLDNQMNHNISAAVFIGL